MRRKNRVKLSQTTNQRNSNHLSRNQHGYGRSKKSQYFASKNFVIIQNPQNSQRQHYHVTIRSVNPENDQTNH